MQQLLFEDTNLLKKFEDIHNYIYANEGYSQEQSLDEIIKILFILFYDKLNNKNEFNISNQEFEEIKEKGKSKSFIERMYSLFKETLNQFSEIFLKDETIKLTSHTLSYIVNKLQNVDLSSDSDDTNGLAFQKFLNSHNKRDRGQFFTPDPVINCCVEIINPQKNETIIDPACGSGGFLLSAYKFIVSNNPKLDKKKYVTNNLYGLDINNRISKISKIRFLLECNANLNIFCQNALTDIDEINLRLNNQKFDILLTNPPFGTIGKISNKKILNQYDLGFKWIKDSDFIYNRSKQLLQHQVPEILFIERCLDLLKEGGRMGIVLPNGHFENSSLEYLRYYIKTKARVLSIISLPPETFIPFGTGIKASLLFLEKTEKNLNNKFKIFFGKISKLGYLGNKNGAVQYKKNKFGIIERDKTGTPIIDEDLSEIISYYKDYTSKNIFLKKLNVFTLDYSDLNGRFDFNFYSPEFRTIIKNISKEKGVQLKELVTIVKLKSKKLKNQSMEVEYVELSDINTHSLEIINSTKLFVHELPSRASYELKEKDIITAVAGNSIGTEKHATAYVEKEYAGCICTNGFRILRNFKIDPFYLLYYFKTSYFLKQLFMYRTGAAIPSICDDDLNKILVYLPNDKIISEISKTVKESFELRKQSKELIEKIDIKIN